MGSPTLKQRISLRTEERGIDKEDKAEISKRREEGKRAVGEQPGGRRRGGRCTPEEVRQRTEKRGGKRRGARVRRAAKLVKRKICWESSPRKDQKD